MSREAKVKISGNTSEAIKALRDLQSAVSTSTTAIRGQLNSLKNDSKAVADSISKAFRSISGIDSTSLASVQRQLNQLTIQREKAATAAVKQANNEERAAQRAIKAEERKNAYLFRLNRGVNNLLLQQERNRDKAAVAAERSAAREIAAAEKKAKNEEVIARRILRAEEKKNAAILRANRALATFLEQQVRERDKAAKAAERQAQVEAKAAQKVIRAEEQKSAQILRINRGINSLLQRQAREREKAAIAAESQARREAAAAERRARAEEAAAARIRRQQQRQAQQASQNSRLNQNVSLGIGGLAAITGVGAGIGAIASLTDKVKELEARFIAVTNSTENFNRAFNETLRIASETGSSLDSVAQIYSRLLLSSDALGVSQERITRVTETIAKVSAISGGGKGVDQAINQLSQGLAAGTLRGEELNSVLEQTPILAQAIADGLGLSVGQLRTISQEGLLTTETVISALENAGSRVDDTFGRVDVTVARALNEIQVAFLDLVRDVDDTTGASSSFVDVLRDLRDTISSEDFKRGIEGVATAFVSIAQAVGAAADGVLRFTAAAGRVSGDIVSGIDASLGAELTDEQAARRLAQVDLEIEQRRRDPTRGRVTNTLRDFNAAPRNALAMMNIFTAPDAIAEGLQTIADGGFSSARLGDEELSRWRASLAARLNRDNEARKAVQDASEAAAEQIEQFDTSIADAAARIREAEQRAAQAEREFGLGSRESALAERQLVNTLRNEGEDPAVIQERINETVQRRLALVNNLNTQEEEAARARIAAIEEEIARARALAEQRGTLANFEELGSQIYTERLEAAQEELRDVLVQGQERIVEVQDRAEQLTQNVTTATEAINRRSEEANEQAARAAERAQEESTRAAERAAEEAARAAEAQARLTAARLELSRISQEVDFSIQDATANRQRGLLEDQFSQNLIGAELYYQQLADLDRQRLDRQQALLESELEINQALMNGATSEEDQIRLQGRQVELAGELNMLEIERLTIQDRQAQALRENAEAMREVMFKTGQSELETFISSNGVGNVRADMMRNELQRDYYRQLLATKQEELELALIQEGGASSRVAQLRLEVEELRAASTEVNELGKAIEDSFQSSFENLIESVANGTKSIKDAFLDLFNSLAASITQFVARDLTNNLMGSLFGGGGNGKGSGGLGAGFSNMLGGLFGGGSTGTGSFSKGGSSGGGGIVNSLMGLIGGFFETGGDARMGVPYVVGERGPELFVPKQAGTVMNNSASQQAMSRGSGGVVININTPDSNSFRKSQGQIANEVANTTSRFRSRNS